MLVTYQPVYRKLPTTMSRIFLVHGCEAISTSNPFIRLKPIQHKVIAQQGTNRPEVVRHHQIPEPRDNFYGLRSHPHASCHADPSSRPTAAASASSAPPVAWRSMPAHPDSPG